MQKSFPKKQCQQKEVYIFYFFNHDHKTEMSYNLFMNFSTFSSNEKQPKIYFSYHSRYFSNEFFWIMVALFTNFKAKCGLNSSRNENAYYMNVSKF